MFDEYLNDILNKINFRTDEFFLVKDILSKIKNELEVELEYDIETHLIGSIYKNTAIDKQKDENFDIDFLILPNEKNDFLKIKNYFKKKYGKDFLEKPLINKIFIKYKSYIIDIILGFYECNFTYKIPDMKSKNNYITFNFTEEKNFLYKKDTENKNVLIKLIKLLKYLNNCFSFDFSSYSIEKSVLKMSYSKINNNLTDYLFEFLLNLKENPRYSNIANENIKKIHIAIDNIKKENNNFNLSQIKQIVPANFV